MSERQRIAVPRRRPVEPAAPATLLHRADGSDIATIAPLSGGHAFDQLRLRAANQQVIQRQDGGETASAPAALDQSAMEPRVEATKYGIFLVYPDTVGLRPADYSELEWPVTESAFHRIETVIESIESGGAGIDISGTAAFKASVLMDLSWLLTQSVGMELIEAIVGSGKQLTIRESKGGNTTSYNPNPDSFERPDGTRGPGANVTIGYNTREWNPYGGDEEWMTRPPAIGLAHELVHAWTGMIGTRALGETGGVNRRELQATGLGEFANSVFTENRFRGAFGLPLRPRY